MHNPTMAQRLGAEFLGTFVLVFGGCGAAVFSAVFVAPNLAGAIQVGIGFVGVALAFGLSVLTMVYALGHISGGHFNPAVTVGLSVAQRFAWREVPHYIGAQVAGGLVGGLAIWGIAGGKAGWSRVGNMAANGFGEHSPGGYSLTAVLVAEALLTAVFVYLILGVTDTRAPDGFAPLAIGLGLTLIHLISIPISNTSVNPARSTAVAFFNGNGAPAQLWLFWVAPILGAAIAGATFHLVTGVDRRDRDIDGEIDLVDALVEKGVDPNAPR